MFGKTLLRRSSAGTVALFAFAATAQAADISISDARIEGGKLVVSGTAGAGAKLRLDGRFNATADGDGAFSFSKAYVPSDCVVSVSSAGASTDAAVANCGLGLTPRGGWNTAADYAANDLVTHGGATWLARRDNAGKQPAAGADWQLFAAAGTDGQGADANAAAKRVPPTGPASGDLIGNYPGPLLRNGSVTTNKIENNAVTPVKIANGSLTTEKFQAAAITAQKLANSAVLTAKINNNAVTAAKIADLAISNAKLGPNSVTSDKIADGAVTGADILDGTVSGTDILDGTVASADVLDESLTSSDLATDSVAASEIVDDSIGSAEIAPGIVGADELDTVHEHIGPATNITSDPTAHDGSYTLSTASVSCGTGEDLLSVSVDWTATGGHNERMFVGVSSITRGEPDSATVEVAYDGGATTATWTPVATCIF